MMNQNTGTGTMRDSDKRVNILPLCSWVKYLKRLLITLSRIYDVLCYEPYVI